MAGTHPLVERFRAGGVPEPLKLAAARGALPLAPEDLLEILFVLRTEQAPEIQAEIRKTLAGLPQDVLLEVAGAPETAPALLDFLARGCFQREVVVEKVALNAATPDATVQLVAQHGSESLLDLISLNQVRLGRSPAILQAMLANPRLSVTTRRRLKEIWDLHQAEVAARAARGRAAAPAAPQAQPVPATPAPPPAPSAPPAPATGGPAPPIEAPDAAAEGDLAPLDVSSIEQRILDEMAAEEATEEELRLAQKLLTMTVPDKVQLATLGSREARAILIRDPSKMVQEAVINSPKITENEIEKITNMRSISDDLIRQIAGNRDYTKNYAVVHNLVRNPKTPQPTALQLMPRLQNRDLTLIIKDKNIPDVVRRHARITLDKRNVQTKKPGA